MTKADIKHPPHVPWYAVHVQNLRTYTDMWTYILLGLGGWNLGFGALSLSEGEWVGYVQIAFGFFFPVLALWLLHLKRGLAKRWAESVQWWNAKLEDANKLWWELPEQLKPEGQRLVDQTVKGLRHAEEMAKKYPLPEEES